MDYIMTDDYEGPDRRNKGFDLQVTLAKLIAKVESTEQNIATKIESMELVHAASSKALESKVDSLIARLEAQVEAAACSADSAANDAAEALKVTDDQEHKLMQFETTGRGVISMVSNHEKALKSLDKRVSTLEGAPGAASLRVLKWAAGVVGGLILTGIVGLIYWALAHPTQIIK